MKIKLHVFSEPSYICVVQCIDEGIQVGHVFSSFFRRQQQERQGQPGVFLLWLHRLLCGPGTDRSGDAHF